MPETILITIGNHHLGFTLPTPRAPVYIPRNHTFQLKENVTNQLQSPNEYGKLPYETNWVLIKKLMEDPHPFVSLETNHNFILGQNRLLFAPRNGAFGWTDWEACERESALRNPFNQPLPIVNEYNTRNANAWNAGGAWAAFPASSSAPSASASARSSRLLFPRAPVLLQPPLLRRVRALIRRSMLPRAQPPLQRLLLLHLRAPPHCRRLR